MSSLEQSFPALRDYRTTSPQDARYNCISWAAGDVRRFWWPGAYWPGQDQQEESLEAFVAVFEALGFERCEGQGLEPGREKVALYVDAARVPTHAARQLPSGRWTSKLGKNIDIEHAGPADLEGKIYGRVACTLRRLVRRAGGGG